MVCMIQLAMPVQSAGYASTVSMRATLIGCAVLHKITIEVEIYSLCTHDVHLCYAFDVHVQGMCRVEGILIHTLMLSSYRVLDSSFDSGCDRSIAYRILV